MGRTSRSAPDVLVRLWMPPSIRRMRQRTLRFLDVNETRGRCPLAESYFCTNFCISSSSLPASAHFPCALNSRYRCKWSRIC